MISHKNRQFIIEAANNVKCCDLIISLTTYKDRLQEDHLNQVLDRIFAQKFNGKLHCVVNLTQYDYQFCSARLLKYFSEHNVEVLFCPKNLKPHLKYFYAMQKYRNCPILTIDDDCLYDADLIPQLWNSYLQDATCIHARRCHLMLSDKNNFFLPYKMWPKKYTKITVPSYRLLATGVGGVLYPPNILKLSNECLPEIQASINADDIFLKKRENELGIRVKFVGNKPDSYENLPEWKNSTALQLSNNINGNDQTIKALKFKPIVNLHRTDKITIILRVCDSVECIHTNLCKNNKREFGNGKIDVIQTSIKTLATAIKFSKQTGIDCNLYVVNDALQNSTIAKINEILADVQFKWIKTKAHGNIGSFKTCYEIALTFNPKELILFAEDDYLFDKAAIAEIVNFYNMFDKPIFMNPTTDIGDEKIVPVNSAKQYKQTTIFPSSKEGIGIWWKQTWHSTSTFATSVSKLQQYKYIFDEIFQGQKLNQYIRNKIYQIEQCFTPIYPLMQHYQKSKTMYWFDTRNSERECKYVI